jgi:hypothetical protein
MCTIDRYLCVCVCLQYRRHRRAERALLSTPAHQPEPIQRLDDSAAPPCCRLQTRRKNRHLPTFGGRALVRWEQPSSHAKEDTRACCLMSHRSFTAASGAVCTQNCTTCPALRTTRTNCAARPSTPHLARRSSSSSGGELLGRASPSWRSAPSSTELLLLRWRQSRGDAAAQVLGGWLQLRDGGGGGIKGCDFIWGGDDDAALLCGSACRAASIAAAT